MLLSINTSSLIDLNALGNELDVRNVVLVGPFNIRQDQLLDLYRRLLCLVLLFVRHLCDRGLPLARTSDTVLNRAQVPSDHLAINSATDDHSWVLRVKLNRCDLNRRLQNIIERDDVRILKVEYQHVGLEAQAHQVDSVLVGLEVLHQRNSDQMLLGRVEPNTADSLLLAVLLFEVGARHHIDRAILATGRRVFIAQHLEVVLEHIDDLVRLQSFLDSELDAVDKLIKFGVDVTAGGRLLSDLFDEVLGAVLDGGVDCALVVGLGLEGVYLASGLQTHGEHFLFGDVLDVAGLSLEFEVDGHVCSVLLNHLEVIEAELLPRLSHAHLVLGSGILDNETIDLLLGTPVRHVLPREVLLLYVFLLLALVVVVVLVGALFVLHVFVLDRLVFGSS